MLFNSLEYFVFLPIVFMIYWIMPQSKRWMVLLTASCYFYMCWNPKYILLIALVTLTSYGGSILIEMMETDKKRKLIVFLVSIICFGILFIFKYFNFVFASISSLFNHIGLQGPNIAFQLLLPVGISFYTFQAIGYVIDVYRKDVKAETHLGKYAVFISFFPQLLAGPIARSRDLLVQLKEDKKFDYNQSTYGLKLMAWGYFKKIVIADTLAAYVDKIYADLHFFSGGARLVIIVFFAIQIYCDFSGYSDIARGTAKLFGIELMVNFKSPYFAKSIREFWQRWHISLSTWFRDYLYIPLGGSRVSTKRHAVNLMITFLTSGIWHGASWTFLVWGGMHGFMQILEKKTKKITNWWNVDSRFHVFLKTLINFVIISLLWVFFKAKTINDAVYTIVYVYSGFETPIQYIMSAYHNLGLNVVTAIQIIIMLIILFLYDYASLRNDIIQKISLFKMPVRWSIYIGFMILMFIFAPSSSAEFIYFDF